MNSSTDTGLFDERTAEGLSEAEERIDSAAENGSPTLLDHLAELRSRLIRGLLSIIPGFIIAYNLAGPIMELLIRPLKKIMPAGQGLIATGLPDTFIIHLKISLWSGLLISSPYWLHQIWAFVAPGLYRGERRRVARWSLSAALLMLAGAAFAYFTVFPLAFRFFIGFSGEDVAMLPTITQYLSLVMTIMLAFGLAFQLPLVLLFLNRVGLVDAARLRRFRRYAILLIVILAAVMTPPDVVSQILMSLPMIGLYELSIVLMERPIKEAGEQNSLES
ncbi:twin-arginine translocase subunit TatC [Deltaproteobacteria bacterium Smac51]|nr:twin-arginine translocase subunit TatC [Deltaproteobacteria bacterium Smac51]